MERLHLDRHRLSLRHNLAISLQKIETETYLQQKLLNQPLKTQTQMQIGRLDTMLLVSNIS